MTSKIVLVTGASSGIGRATAEYLYEKGHFVYGLSRSKPMGDFSFVHLACDLTDSEQIVQIKAIIEKECGKIDVLVNCAGVGIGGAIEETERKDIDWLFSVNVQSVIQLTQEMIPLLRKGTNPKIINIGSIAGTLVIPFQAFYSMSKASLSAFSEALRLELKPFKIDVTTILPGDTKTGFTLHRKVTDSKANSLYKERMERSLKKMEQDEQHGKSPLTVAKKIGQLIHRRIMPVNVAIGFEYKLFLFLKRILPNRFVSWVLYQMYGK
ncbi:MAG: SDR family NAD(P)-dependent oxidoreductase [Candidatus Izemoplasmatales bacterium]|jgi:short-subunit dehydrogenase|nr:SDR family NAD(P)-dependent oxidoreductase [Candidatus Izemoplasmatales bacterium]MDD4988076.1 SDR family NAD(P)-dependent oxidoreductase [Candidatus Izemoplasmatales bacterium]MDY0373273.1 SDR family NAD(P)-dependent oxidoreductase [Candidatus Izemoplasmatales bacterium]NLF48136.1 SDR family NAD(P)-dependent oxidoreductase [Acholeplasmataceae bacterium]